MDGNWGVEAYRYAYLALAAMAGSVTALASSKWKEMTRLELFINFISGFGFAVFVTPWIAEKLIGVPQDETRLLAALTYIAAAGSNIIIPKLIAAIAGRVQ